jgi:hypothetical protein
MKRDEAVACFKEFSEVCQDVSAVSLVESKPTDISDGYQLRIKTPIASVDNRQLVKDIVEKRQLAIKEKIMKL